MFADVAYAMLRFRDEAVVTWEMALRPDWDLSTLSPNPYLGFGVDGGEACFVDVQALESERELYRRRSDEMQGEVGWTNIEKLTAPFFRKMRQQHEDANWQGNSYELEVDPLTGANMIVFRSGLGDGAYASYWGLAADGEPT